MSPSIRAVVLAGGLGTRVRHLLPDLPKPLAPVAGRPFVDWLLEHLRQSAGATDFVFSTGHLAEKVREHFEQAAPAGLTVRCCAESRPLGTAGGFLHCVHSDPRPPPDLWIVANGDSLVFADFRPLLAAFIDPAVGASILAVRMADASRYGTVDRDAHGGLVGFREKTPGAGLINAGVYVFRHALTEEFSSRRPLSFEQDVFPALLSRHRIAVVETRAPFLDIGTEASFRAAEAFIRANLYRFAAPDYSSP